MHCQGCGALLPSPDAVCARCEAELTAEPPAPPARYICPHCHARFAALAQVPWPPHVPWWRPTTLRLQCPHCDTPLRDRHAVRFPPWFVAAGVVAALGISLFTVRWVRLGLSLLLIAAFYAPLAWAFWKARRTPDDPHRFVVGTTRFMAQGNDELRTAVERRRHGSNDPSG